ncbi:hypothetical protein ABZ639_24405 [Saccharomonospora sp. NPDC006951]
MVEPEPTGPSYPEWVYSGEKTLDAEPDSFRGYGQNIAALGSNFRDDLTGPVMLLHGGGEDISLSTGGMPEGGYCEQLAGRNASEMSGFMQDLSTNLLAIPSAALILAELYENTDDANGASLAAVNYAFALSPDKPPGVELPEYIDGTTIEETMEESGEADNNPAQDRFISGSSFTGGNTATYETASGGRRVVTNTINGRTEKLYDKDGNLIYESSGDQEGNITTTNYDKDGEELSTTERRTENDGGHQRNITETTNADGEVTQRTTQHMITTEHDDGTQSREYYTETEKWDEDEEALGDPERSGERYIGAQPEAMGMDDWRQRMDQQMEQSRRQTGF